MSISESFRDACEELADAEQALATVAEYPPEVRLARQMEWQQLIDRLIDEVAAELTRRTTPPIGG